MLTEREVGVGVGGVSRITNSSNSGTLQGKTAAFPHSSRDGTILRGRNLTRQRLAVQKEQVASMSSPVELTELWGLIICGESMARRETSLFEGQMIN